MKIPILSVRTSLVLFLCLAANEAFAQIPNAFGRSSVNGDSTNTQMTSGLRVFRIAGPPLSNSTNFATGFAQGPITDAVSRPEALAMLTSTDTQVGRWELLWSDRNTMDGWGKIPNDPSGLLYLDPNAATRIQCRTAFYDTATGLAHDPDKGYRYAIGSTLVRAAYTVGLDFWDDTRHPDGKGWGQIAIDYGYDVTALKARWDVDHNDPIFTQDLNEDTGDIVHRAFCEAPENRANFFWLKINEGGKDWYTSVNRVVLNPVRLIDINVAPAGIYLDHEHQDNRTQALETEYITELAKIVHCVGMEIHISSEPPAIGNIGLNMGIFSGPTGNAWTIVNLVDSFNLLQGKNFDYSTLQDQFDFFKGPGGESPAAHLTMQVVVGQLESAPGTPDTTWATNLKNFMSTNGITRLWFPGGPGAGYTGETYAFGGPLSTVVNQLIATLTGLPTSISAPSAAPTGLTVTAPANHPLTLSWTAASNATSYKVKRATAGLGPYTDVAEVTDGTNSYADRGLSPTVHYYYVVSSANFGGQSANSPQSNAITSSALVPDIPIGMALTPGAGQLTLNWTASSGATSYNVKRSSGGSAYSTVGTPGTNSFTDTGLTDGTRYFYKVSAVNGTGESGDSAAVSQLPIYPSAPLNLRTTGVTASSVSLQWDAAINLTSYTVKRGTSGWGPFTTLASSITGTTYTDSTITPATTYYYVVSAVNSGGEGVNSLQTDSLASQDIGSVSLAGAASQVLEVSVLEGAGDFIWAGADDFRYKYKAMTGDCTIVAHIASVENTDAWAQAGVMIRESLAANSTHAFMAISAANGANFVWRATTGGASAQSRALGISAPYWVKLVRSGSSLSGYRSSDGVTWTQVGSAVTISMASTVYVGLAVNAHNDTTLCEAVFDSVTTF